MLDEETTYDERRAAAARMEEMGVKCPVEPRMSAFLAAVVGFLFAQPRSYFREQSGPDFVFGLLLALPCAAIAWFVWRERHKTYDTNLLREIKRERMRRRDEERARRRRGE